MAIETIPLADLTPAGAKRFLDHYRHYRRTHPLPDGWTENLTEVERVAAGEPAYPEVVFSDEDLTVEVDLANPGRALVAFRDLSGEGLGVPAMFELTRELIGAEVSESDLEQYDADELFAPGCPGEVWMNHFAFNWESP